eukprot:2772504-Prymnesium_polylepis.1
MAFRPGRAAYVASRSFGARFTAIEACQLAGCADRHSTAPTTRSHRARPLALTDAARHARPTARAWTTFGLRPRS